MKAIHNAGQASQRLVTVPCQIDGAVELHLQKMESPARTAIEQISLIAVESDGQVKTKTT